MLSSSCAQLDGLNISSFTTSSCFYSLYCVNEGSLSSTSQDIYDEFNWRKSPESSMCNCPYLFSLAKPWQQNKQSIVTIIKKSMIQMQVLIEIQKNIFNIGEGFESSQQKLINTVFDIVYSNFKNQRNMTHITTRVLFFLLLFFITKNLK